MTLYFLFEDVLYFNLKIVVLNFSVSVPKNNLATVQTMQQILMKQVMGV